MERIEVLAFPATTWERQDLEDIAVRNLVLEQYDRESVAIQRYLIFSGIDRETAQEAVQESFLRLQQHLLRDGDRVNLRAWLYRVAHNLARNAQCAHSRSRTESLPDATATGELSDRAGSAEDILLAEEQLKRLRLAMKRLSTAQRDALMLRTQGLKYREIAEVLSLSVSTVGENIQRGLERLKELL